MGERSLNWGGQEKQTLSAKHILRLRSNVLSQQKRNIKSQQQDLESANKVLHFPSQRPPRWHSGKASAWRAGAGDPAIIALRVTRLSHTNDFNNGTLGMTLPSAWRSRVSDRTSWPGVNLPLLGEKASLFCNVCLSVEGRSILYAGFLLLLLLLS